MFNFVRSHQTVFPKWLHYSATPLAMNESSSCFMFSPTLGRVILFLCSHSHRYVVISYCGFNWQLLIMFSILFMCFFGKISVHIFCPFLNQLVVLLLNGESFVYILDICILSDIKYQFHKYFLPVYGSPIHFLNIKFPKKSF